MTLCSIKCWCGFRIHPERIATNLRQRSFAECRKMGPAGWEAQPGMACMRCAYRFQIGQRPRKISMSQLKQFSDAPGKSRFVMLDVSLELVNWGQAFDSAILS